MIKPLVKPLVTAIRKALIPDAANDLLLQNDLQNTLVPQFSAGSGTPTFTRATTATVYDFESVLRNAKSGESRFRGARQVINDVVASQDMTNGAWSADNGAVIDSATQVTFDGTLNGGVQQTIAFTDDGGGAGTRSEIYAVDVTFVSGVVPTNTQCRVQIEGDAMNAASINIGTQLSSTTLRYTVNTTNDAAGSTIIPRIECDTATVLSITRHQEEESTGRADTTTPSEPVSTGVLSAPFHGANVDGVQYFKTNNGNTVSNNVVTEAVGTLINLTNNPKLVMLDGVSGSCAATPDSVASSVTGDITIIAYVAADDWTPSAAETFIGKWDVAGNERTYLFVLLPAGTIELSLSANGISNVSAASVQSTGFTNGTAHWVRCSWDNSANTVNYYTSDDPASADPADVNWTRLNTSENLSLVSAGINDGSSETSLGSYQNCTQAPLSGSIYKVTVTASTDPTATPGVSFNASDHINGAATLTSSETSEVWTLGGGAVIPFAYYNADGTFRYIKEDATTNVALHNRDQTDVVWVKSNMTAAKDEIGIDKKVNGASSLLATGANATSLQTFVIGSTDQVVSFHLKRLIGTGNVDITLDNGATWTTVPLASVYQRFNVPATLANPVIGIRIVTSGDKVAIDYAQLEVGEFPTSEIETTTTSEPRNTDSLTYPGLGNIESLAGTIFVQVSSDWDTAPFGSSRVALSRGTTGALLVGQSSPSDRIIAFDGSGESDSPVGTNYHNTLQKIATTWGDDLIAFSPGTLLPDLSPPTFDPPFGTGDLTVGSFDGGLFPWSGTVGGILIYNRTFTTEEVQA